MPRVAGPALIMAAREGGYALPAINVANMETAQAVVAAAQDSGSPVILQVSPGAIVYAGYEAITAIAFAEADRAATPVLVHLDHCRDPDVVGRALDDGYGSVMFDGSVLSADENVRLTREVVTAAAPLGIAVEGELGYIGGREEMSIAEARAAATTPAEAAEFVMATGVDVLAPAIGTLHRMPGDSVSLDLDLIRAIGEACQRPLVLHGGSGVSRRVLAAAIAAGVAKVNISSRVSWALAEGIRSTWEADPDQLDLRAFLAAGRQRVREMASEYMRLCGSAGRVDAGKTTAVAEASFEPE